MPENTTHPLTIEVIEKTPILAKFRVHQPTEERDRLVEAWIDRRRASFRVDGFRPGKAPASLVRERLMLEALTAVRDDAIQKSLKPIEDQHPMHVIGRPELTGYEEKEGNIFWEFTFHLMPQMEDPDLSADPVVNPMIQVQEKDMQRLIAEAKRAIAEFDEVDRPSVMGSRLLISTTATMGGEDFPGGAMQKVSVDIGENRFIPGFEDGLVGLKAGETKTLDLVFPDDYKPDLAGKSVSFEVTVHAVSEAREVTDQAIAEARGVESFDVWQASAREALSKPLPADMLIYYKRALIDRLDKVFENTMLPPTFVAEQVHQIRQGFEAQMSKDASEQGESDSPDSSADAQPDDAELNSYLSLSPEAREAFVERLAKRRVRAGIFLMQYAERHDLKITREDLLEVVSTRYSIPASMHEMFLNYLEKDKKAMREIANIAIENIAVRHAIDRLCRLEPKEFETSEACAKFMVEYVSRGVDA